MQLWAKRLLSLVILGLAIAIAVSFFGRWLAAFDSFAHFRWHFTLALVLLAVLAAVARFWVPLSVALSAVALGFSTTLPWMLPAPDVAVAEGQPAYSLLQMNVLYYAEPGDALRRIAETRADVVTLQEVSHYWRDVLEVLGETYPYRTYCGIERGSGEAVLSRRPFVGEAICNPKEARLTQGVDFNGRAVSVTSLHLTWPWPRKQWQQIERLEDALRTIPIPSILGGDFNAAPWSAAVETVAEAGGWRTIRGVGPTWVTKRVNAWLPRWLGIPIDQLMASPGIEVLSVETLAHTGSDHLPVLFHFSLEAREPSSPRPSNAVALR